MRVGLAKTGRKKLVAKIWSQKSGRQKPSFLGQRTVGFSAVQLYALRHETTRALNLAQLSARCSLSAVIVAS